MTGRPPRAYAFAARLARREVRRRPWRTLLVALLVAGPVAGMVVAAVLVRAGDVPPALEWRQQLGGSADAVVHGNGAVAGLPAGTRVVPFHRDYLQIRSPGRPRVFGEVTDLTPAEPLARGFYVRVAGRSPERPGEVMLSRHAARLLGVRLGVTFDLVKPWPVRVTVVGVAERSAGRGLDFAIVAPGTPFPLSQQPSARLLDLPDALSRNDVAAFARSVLASGTPAAKPSDAIVLLSPRLARLVVPARVVAPPDRAGEKVAWTWVIGAAVLAVVGIVIASAFAAGSRRQLTTLGQLAANGAGPRVLRRVLLLQGTWTGVVGAVLGLAGGAALLAALAPYRYDLLNRDTGPYDVRPLELVPVVLLAVVAATVAALVPARTASRTPVLNALAGRRPLGAVPRWLAPAGVAGSAVGLALLGLAVLGATSTVIERSGPGATRVWAVTGGIGAVAVLLGACAVAPRYVGVLDPLGTRLHGAWRFAARSLARQRTRTAGVVCAIGVTTALALAGSALALAVAAQERNRTPYVPVDQVQVTAFAPSSQEVPFPRPAVPPAAVLADVAGAVPAARRVDVPLLQPPPGTAIDAVTKTFQPDAETDGSPPPFEATSAAVATPEVLRLYGADRRVRDALAADGAVGLGYAAGSVRLGDLRVTVLDRTRYSFGTLPPLLLSAPLAARLGWTAGPSAVVFDLGRPLNAAERSEVWGVYQDWSDANVDSAGPGTAPSVNVAVDQPPATRDPLALQGMLAAAALAFSIFFVAVSLALAGAETRDERDALTIAGAGTRMLRRTSGRKAFLVTLLGAALGLPVGLLPVVVLTRVDTTSLPFVMPWLVAALLVAFVPVAAGVVTSLASTLALRLAPVRISTMTYE
jgi:putative ABC transport system permease protein